MRIGIVGNGFVGKATQIFGRGNSITTFIFDIDPTKCSPADTTYGVLAHKCDLVFICVPTPMNPEIGDCNISIVRNCVEKLKQENGKAKIIVRSTVPPGTCEKLNVAHMPEYLTEANWERDFLETKEWHLGVPVLAESQETVNLFSKLINFCYASDVLKSNIVIVRHTSVTETTKYFKNAMLAVKVALCNEFEEYCRAVGTPYSEVRELIISDPRIGPSHTAVPGPDGKRGFGGTCLPKDLSSLIVSMLEANVMPSVLNAAKTRNETIDRPSKEWLLDYGRAVSKKN